MKSSDEIFKNLIIKFIERGYTIGFDDTGVYFNDINFDKVQDKMRMSDLYRIIHMIFFKDDRLTNIIVHEYIAEVKRTLFTNLDKFMADYYVSLDVRDWVVRNIITHQELTVKGLVHRFDCSYHEGAIHYYFENWFLEKKIQATERRMNIKGWDEN